MRCIAFALTLLPLPAFADCGGGIEVFTCQIGNKTLKLCHQGDDLTYAFGPKSAPDLVLTAPLLTVNFTPWLGISGSFSGESVTFVNDNYAYRVWTLVDINFEATTGPEGGVQLWNGVELVANLTCDQGTASQSLDAIWGLKESVGLCWEFGSQSWKATCNNG